MHPVLSIGSYIFTMYIILSLTGWCTEGAGLTTLYGSAGGRTAIVLFSLAAVLPVLGTLLPDSRIKFALQGAGNIWLGFYIYYGSSLALLWGIYQIFRRITGRERSRTVCAALLLICILLSVGGMAYGMIHAQHTVVTRLSLDIEKKTKGTEEVKLILIGDLHLSVNSHLSTIERMVELINGEKADAVLIAGDIFTSSYNSLKDPEKYAAVLRGLQSTYGTYAVYGNHDVEEGLFGGFPVTPIARAFRSKKMEDFFTACNFRTLYEETALIADGQIQIVGRADGEKAGNGTAIRKSPAEILADIDPEKPVIVLQHEPVEFAALKESGADLALCGHTHAGQFFPGNLIVPFFNENAYGFKVVGGLYTVVTSGIGYYGPPMRVGTNSEIMVLTLRFTGPEA